MKTRKSVKSTKLNVLNVDRWFSQSESSTSAVKAALTYLQYRQAFPVDSSMLFGMYYDNAKDNVIALDLYPPSSVVCHDASKCAKLGIDEETIRRLVGDAYLRFALSVQNLRRSRRMFRAMSLWATFSDSSTVLTSSEWLRKYSLLCFSCFYQQSHPALLAKKFAGKVTVSLLVFTESGAVSGIASVYN